LFIEGYFVIDLKHLANFSFAVKIFHQKKFVNKRQRFLFLQFRLDQEVEHKTWVQLEVLTGNQFFQLLFVT